MVARLVARDVGEQVLQERLLGQVPHLAKRVEREPFDDDLHADELLHPVAGLERLVEDALERRRDRPDLVELLDVAGEHLDVPRLVHRLRGGVELGVGVRHGVHELRGDHERALLAVQELREPKRRRARVSSTRVSSESERQYDVFSIGTPAPSGVVENFTRSIGLIPVELFLADPLRLGRLHVEVPQLLDLGIVVPLVDDLHRGREVGLLGRGLQREVAHVETPEAYSLEPLACFAASSFLMSSGESFGRSIVSVILSILPVNANGTW